MINGGLGVSYGGAVRFAIKTMPQHKTWQAMLDVWRAADDIDLFESAWNWDHFYPLTGDHAGPNFEGWTMFAAMATRHLQQALDLDSLELI